MKIKKCVSRFVSIVLVFITAVVFQGCGLLDGFGKETEYIDKEWGETFEFCGIEFTFNRYEFINWAWHGSYEADSNKVWLLIYAKLQNNSTETISLNDFVDKVVYINNGEEAEYNSKWYLNSERWINAHDDIEAYETIEGVFMYEIPMGIVPGYEGKYGYKAGGKYESNETKNINFEMRLFKNQRDAKEFYVIKL